jgi:hypothetical protein
MLLSRHQNAGQNHDTSLIKMAHKCFENVAQFRYLGNKSKSDSGEN